MCLGAVVFQMAMYRLGLIIPTIKESPFLKEAISSVASAINNLPIEVFVFQNGHVIEDKSKYEAILPAINWVESQKVEHVAQSWNRCVDIVGAYDLIHILHDDDFVHPDFYKKIYALALEHCDAGLLATGVLQVDEQSKPLRYKPYNSDYFTLSKSERIAAAETNIFECVGVVMFRKNIGSIAVFSDQFKLLTDWDAWTRLTLEFGAVQDPSVLAYYRIHSKNYSKALRASGRDAMERIRFFREYSEFRLNSLNDKRRIVRALIMVARDLRWAVWQSKDVREMMRFVGVFSFILLFVELCFGALISRLFGVN